MQAESANKLCCDCLIRKPLSAFYLAGYGAQLRPECRPCRAARIAAQLQDRRLSDGARPASRECARCHEVKLFDLNNFKKCSARKWGLTGECKSCLRQREVDRLAAKKSGAPKKTIPDDLSDRVKDPLKTKETRAKWNQQNPEKPRSISRNYRARKRGADGQHSSADVIRLLSAQRWKCAACKAELIKYHVDHVVPLARGGSNGPDNLQILCPSCNCSKSDKDPLTFFQQRGYLL